MTPPHSPTDAERLVLPQQPPTDNKTPATDAPSAAEKKEAVRRILIVEDDFLIAMQTESALTAAGFDVIGTAATAEEAVALRSKPARFLRSWILGSPASVTASRLPRSCFRISASAASLRRPTTMLTLARERALRSPGLANEALYDVIAHSARYRGSNEIGLTGGFAPADERRPTPISMKERPMAIRCDIHGVHDEHGDP